MSNNVQYDPLLVRYLAGELDRELRGRACAAAPLFAAERSATLALDRGQSLQLDLHPTRGWIRWAATPSSSDELDAVCLGVSAPVDERILEIRIRAGDRFRVAERRLVVELHTNQWNALLVSEDDGRIVSALRARTAGKRVLRPGQPYAPPPAAGRFGADEADAEAAWARWTAEIGDAAPEERRGRLLAGFAYTGALNAGWVLGAAAGAPGEAELRSAFRRWWWLRGLPPLEPRLIRGRRGPFPYPVPLAGMADEAVGSLLKGMERVAEEPAVEAEADPDVDEARRWVARRARAAERRIQRLEEEARGAGEAERLRGWGDLLLANLHTVTRGAGEARVTDWEGNPLEIPLDPALSPAENAAALYDEARRRERAEARLPELLEQARGEHARWLEAEAELAEGRLPEWLGEEMTRQGGGGAPGGSEPAESRPYRVYLTSGRVEVRVGRSARDNDRLTFGHSRPDDVWLHARSVPGSHVILRWNDPDNAPPARDLEEAATLAALYSKARTSGLVPVDWTRRKYVRKPRGAPPGAVIPQQVKTLFVEPDGAVEERMRAG